MDIGEQHGCKNRISDPLGVLDRRVHRAQLAPARDAGAFQFLVGLRGYTNGTCPCRTSVIARFCITALGALMKDELMKLEQHFALALDALRAEVHATENSIAATLAEMDDRMCRANDSDGDRT